MEITIRKLERDQFQIAFELASKIFAHNSPMHMALGVTLAEYQAYLEPSFMAMAAEGLSFVAVDQLSSRVVGCMIVGDYQRQICSGKIIDGKFAPLAAITEKLRSNYKNRDALEPGEIALVDMGAVDLDYGSRGIYQNLRKTAHKTAQAAGYTKVAGELSSAITQHVVIGKLGHKPVAATSFRGFEFNGKRPFSSIEHPLDYVLAIGNLH